MEKSLKVAIDKLDIFFFVLVLKKNMQLRILQGEKIAHKI
jgi:hypothetical protein